MQHTAQFILQEFVSGKQVCETYVHTLKDAIEDGLTFCRSGHYGYSVTILRNRGYGGSIVAQIDKYNAIHHAEYYRNLYR